MNLNQNLNQKKNVLIDKINNLQQKLNETKEDHEKQIISVKQQNQVELETLTAKSDKDVTTRLDSLKQEIDKKEIMILENKKIKSQN